MDYGGKIRRTELVNREGEPQVSMWKRGDRTSESIGHGEGRCLICGDGDKSAFMKVDGEAGGGRESIKDLV
jgi:hypothetical protein